MKLHEVKYDQPTTRKLTGKLTLSSGLYLRTNFSIHVSFTGSSVSLPMRQEKDEHCELIKVDGNGVAVPQHLFKKDEHIILHSYKTGWLLKGRRWYLEPETNSNKHYDEVRESSYAFPNYANWVQKSINSEKLEDSIKFNPNGVDIALKQLTRKFGRPLHNQVDDEPRYEYWLWQNDIGNDGSYDITLWTTGEIKVHVYSEMGVD